ncbi:MAG: DUF2934 domain-containing protein [Verrucomicrobiia bacterium]
MNVNYPTEEQIRDRAHQIWLDRGGQPGHEVDDWLQAEYELIQLPVRKLAELEPPKRKKDSKLSLVSVVQAAVFLGAEALPHLNR